MAIHLKGFIMADFSLNDFKQKLGEEFGPFSIDFEHKGEEVTLKIASFMTATPEEQVKFTRRYGIVGAFISGEASDADILEATGLTEEQLSEMEDSEIVELLSRKMMEAIKTPLRRLADNKRVFDSFAAQMPDTLVAWFMLVGTYFKKYNLFGVNEEDEGNLGK